MRNSSLVYGCVVASSLLVATSADAALLGRYEFNNNPNDIAVADGADNLTLNNAATTANATGLQYTTPAKNRDTEFVESEERSLRFDGVNDRADFPTSALDFLQGKAGATLMAFIRPEVINGTRGIINFNAGSPRTLGQARASLAIVDGRLRFGLRESDVVGPGETGAPGFASTTDDLVLNANQSYHVAATYDAVSNVAALYINGQEAQVTAFSDAGANDSFIEGQETFSNTPSLAAFIGSQSNGAAEFFGGLIDDARVYDEALDAATIQVIASQVPEPSALALVGIGGLAALRRRRRA